MLENKTAYEIFWLGLKNGGLETGKQVVMALISDICITSSVLCHGYLMECSIEKSGEPPICLFYSFWLVQK